MPEESFIKLLVLDVLKSQEPGVDKYAEEVAKLECVDAISITVVEVDAKTETLKVSIQGENINLEEVRKKIRHLGGTVHSVDKVVASRHEFENTMFYEK
jgi:hypothetical protein